MDGKGRSFCRPALVVYKKDRENCVVLPLSRSDGGSRSDYYPVSDGSFVVFGQVRTISAKRMVRKMGRFGLVLFNEVRSGLSNFLLREKIERMQ